MLDELTKDGCHSVSYPRARRQQRQPPPGDADAAPSSKPRPLPDAIT